MTRPLPVRIQPYANEAWDGYVHRLAQFYGLSRSEVFMRLDPTWALLLQQRPHGLQAVGVAATDDTLQRISDFVNLNVSEVQTMHLLRFHGTALHFTTQDRLAYDPFDGRAQAYPRNIAQLGWLPPLRRRRVCAGCVDEIPLLRQLTWRLPWHVACPTHELLVAFPGARSTNGGTTEAFDAQARLLRLVDGESPHDRITAAEALSDLAAIIDALLIKRHGVILGADSQPDPGLMLSVLSDGLAAVRQPASSGPHRIHEELLSNENDRGRMLRFMARRRSAAEEGLRGHFESTAGTCAYHFGRHRYVFAPTAYRRHWKGTAPVDPRTFPQMLPMRLFVGDLSDLLYPCPVPTGRRVAAIACAMSGTGHSLTNATEHLEIHQISQHKVLREWRRFESEGRDERFWAAVATASDALLSEAVDYRARRLRVEDPAVMGLVASRLPGTQLLHVRAWLVDHWACAQRRKERGQSTVDAVDRIEREHGCALARELDEQLRAESLAG